MDELRLRRLKMLMEPEPGNPREVEGVLNPAAARGPDGALYLFPRLVARHNYSRIGIACVQFDDAGDPASIERLGVALEPEADYERRADGGGGCEDPRITFVEPIHRYVMTYTAFSARGPRVALAESEDLVHWRRLGLATFAPYRGVAFDDVDNKDASLFPVAIPNPSGHPQLAMLHRPLFPGTRPEETACQPTTREVDLDRESIWISYCSMGFEMGEHERFGRFTSHHRLASPVSPWERLKIGGGAPPLLTRHGWLFVYHGVGAQEQRVPGGRRLRYSAGVMILSKEHPQVIRFRTRKPVLMPELPEECRGTVADVVFPSGLDRRDDLGEPNRFDVYYGMADDRIGVARLDLPAHLPPEEALADEKP
jgi:beta-1,2-mannobiose phosphorylase / 1,2-beta-oligomannan phosphorylase